MLRLSKIILLMILLTGRAFAEDAQDFVPDTSDLKSATVAFNDEIRKTSRRLRQLENGVSLTTGVSGILPTANGGTGQNFSAVAQNSIPYFSAIGTMGTIGIGTSGYTLTSQGPSSPPAWISTNTFKFVSKKTVSAATNSGDIAITNTNYYQVTFNITTLSAADRLVIRLNNDTASVYGYYYSGFDSGATSVIANASDSTVAGIQTSPNLRTSGAQSVSGYFYIFPQQNIGPLVIKGSLWGIRDAAPNLTAFSDFFGSWIASPGANATSFRILTNGGANMTGDITVYQIQQQ